ARIDLSLLDAPQEVVDPAVDVGLSHAERQTLVHRRAERDLIDDAAIDARYGNDPARPADIDHLSQHVRAIGFHHHRLLGAVVHRIDRAARMGFQPDGIDALLGALAGREIFKPLEDTFLVEVDRDRAAGPGHREALGHVVDDDDLLRPEHERAASAELTDRPRSPDGDDVGRLYLAMHGRLPA